jgi:capsular polysaccharide biosynthesis protein
VQLHESLIVARRGWWIILACVALGLVLAGWRASSVEPSYASSTQVFIRGNATAARELADAANVATTRVPSYAELAKGNELASRVAESLDLDPESLAGRIQADAVLNTVVVNITASDGEAAGAEEIAGAAAEELSAMVEELETPADQSESVVDAQVVGTPSPAVDITQDSLRTLALGGLLGLLAGFGIALLRERQSSRHSH